MKETVVSARTVVLQRPRVGMCSRFVATFAVLAFALGGAANAQSAGVAATSARDAAETGAPAPDANGTLPLASAAGVGPDYIIGPGDTIQVFVWRSPELTVTVPVRPDGKISTPLVEDIVAVGKTPSQLGREMEKVLSDYVRSPQVNIIVTGAVSALSQVTVLGQVARPQSVGYKEGMTVMDLVLGSGGLTAFASPNRAKLVRKDAAGKETQIRVRLKDLLEKGKLSENVKLLPGDVLIVPQSVF